MHRILRVLSVTLILIVCWGGVLSARDNGNVEIAIKNDTRQSLGTDDYTPNSYPSFTGYHSTGQVDASFDCFGHFGTGFQEGSGNLPVVYLALELQ